MLKKFSWLFSLLKIGCIGFGGGTSLIPVIEQEMVENKKLVSKDEYDSAVIIASITPGALPVEISSGIGKSIGGTLGMILAGVCMALPGVVLTILLAATMNSAGGMVVKQIELLSIGIIAFILSMLTRYIINTFKWAKERKRTLLATIIVLGVLILSAGKSLVKILAFYDIEFVSHFSISTVHILIMSFFVIGYVGGSKIRISRTIIAAIICVIYSLFVSKEQIMMKLLVNEQAHEALYWTLCVVMAVMGIYGVKQGIPKKTKLKAQSPKVLIKEEVAWFLMLVIASIPAFLMMPGVIDYITKGFFSSIISFGGGDAYLTVADGLFVTDGFISENDFYGRLVTIVNVLPGSILCKTLSGIGFYAGYSYAGMWGGLAQALSGFVCSVVGSCSVISFVQYFFVIFDNVKAFKLLKAWVKAIISGLLGTVIMSLVYVCLNVASNYECSTTAVLIELLFIYVINMVLTNVKKINTLTRIIISIALALVIGNVIV